MPSCWFRLPRQSNMASQRRGLRTASRGRAPEIELLAQAFPGLSWPRGLRRSPLVLGAEAVRSIALGGRLIEVLAKTFEALLETMGTLAQRVDLFRPTLSLFVSLRREIERSEHSDFEIVA